MAATHEPPPRRLGRGQPSAVHRWLLRKILSGLPVPVRVVLWNGEEVSSPSGQPVAALRVNHPRALWRILVNPDLGFGDSWSDGLLEVEGDLFAFLDSVYRALRRPPPAGPLTRAWLRWVARPRANSRAGSRDNIHHHYDIGNDFYRLWLDDQLVYTCAYFPRPDLTLEEAQRAKMDHVCRKLRLRSGQRVVEAGCGWGALALHMARHYGVQVTAFNISREQIEYARRRARAEGLERRVQYVEDDYRNISGHCDAFVSVGMLEHVGAGHYRDLGAVIHRCLVRTGQGLIHSIGRNHPSATDPWLERRIFPGAYMPSLGEMTAVFEPWDFSVLDVENLRLHYARTLELWLERFDAQADRVRSMFDERFVRAWRLYLTGARAGFTSGQIQLFQVVFAHALNNEVPWSRADLHAAEARRPAGLEPCAGREASPWTGVTS
jgi:cyclopropane-fatty-acyl-phospholipid synthase